jgi:hypothetical protein
MDFPLGHIHKLSAPGQPDHCRPHARRHQRYRGLRRARDSERSEPGANHNLDADQQHDPASWLLGHGWTADVSRVSWVATAYGRPMTDLQPENLRVIQLVTGQLD